MNLFKSLFCKHDYKFIRNIYGDEINHRCGKRSLWQCEKCGNLEYRDYLEPVGTLFVEMLDRKYDEYYKNRFTTWKQEKEKSINWIKSKMIQAAEQGKCWLDIILVIDESKEDRYYYDKFFEELGLEYDRNLPDKEIQIYDLEYHLRWKI